MKQQEVPDALIDVTANYVQGIGQSETGVAGKAGDRFAPTQAVDDKDRLDEMRGGEHGLGAQVAQMRRLTQP